MDIEKNIQLGSLIQTYGKLLSPNQFKLISESILCDMSLAEVAENENITRQAVLDAVSKAKEKLFKFEQCLKLVDLKNNINKTLSAANNSELKTKILKIMEDY